MKQRLELELDVITELSPLGARIEDRAARSRELIETVKQSLGS